MLIECLRRTRISVMSLISWALRLTCSERSLYREESKKNPLRSFYFIREEIYIYICLRNGIYKNLFGVSEISLARRMIWKMKSTLNSFLLTVFHSLFVLPCIEQIRLNKWKIKFSLYTVGLLYYLMKCPTRPLLFPRSISVHFLFLFLCAHTLSSPANQNLPSILATATSCVPPKTRISPVW